MSKAGASWLRDQLVMSANVARTIDPELARIYYVQMVERAPITTRPSALWPPIWPVERGPPCEGDSPTCGATSTAETGMDEARVASA
jgi:hypothetical protein